jgi:hypothetical protein
MAFRNKSDAILAHNPDLLILQECSQADIENYDAPFKHWVGKNPHKGLGVLGFGNHNFKVADNYNDTIHWAIPIESDEVDVLAMWAHKDAGQTYVEGLLNALSHYDSLLRKDKGLFIGDMNNNVIWDHKTKKEWQWATFLEELKKRDKHSVWHETRNETHGNETMSTLFWRRNIEHGYHIDYVFGSKELTERSSVEIGTHQEWLKHSDHAPLLLDIKPSASPRP